MERKFLTVEDIVNLYGVSEDFIQSLVGSGQLRQLMDRGTAKFRREDVEKLADAGRFSHDTGETLDSSILTDDASHGLTLAGDMQFMDIDIDEDALSEQPTLIRKAAPKDSNPDLQMFTLAADSDIAPGSDNAILEPSSETIGDSDILVHGAESSTSFVGDGSLLNFGGDANSAADEEDDSLTLEMDSHALQESSSSIFDAGDSSLPPESGFTLSTGDVAIVNEGDSGIALELAGDSGIALDKGDSGIALDAGDSGIALDAGDSGIALDAGDSGFTLDEASKKKVAPQKNVRTDHDMPESPSSEILLGDSFHDSKTLELNLVEEDDDDVMGFLQPDTPVSMPVKSSSLSDQYTTVESVEDLEIVDELDAGPQSSGSSELIDAIEDEDAVDEIDEVFEASDESFGDAEAFSDDDLAPAAAAKARGPREPTWGLGAVSGLIAASLILALNGWMIYEGTATMWTGDETSGPLSGIVSSIAGLM